MDEIKANISTSFPVADGALARLVESTEATACADLARAAPARFGFAVEEGPHGIALMAAGVDLLLFNRVLGAGLDAPNSVAELAPVLARYRGLGVRHHGVAWSPVARPAELPRALGLAPRDAWTKMWRDDRPATPAASELRVERVARAHALTFGEVACAGFGMPAAYAAILAPLVGRAGWHTYLAWDGATPVAAGALSVHGTAGWLGVAATLPSARRRGAQGALFARRLADGIAAGCARFVTETGAERPGRPNASLRNMRRAGFVPIYDRVNWMPGAEGA